MTADREAVLRAVTAGWSLASSTRWRPENPAAGQCSVTALLLQDLLGGELLKTRVGEAWHFYNRFDGARLDLTASQFAAPIRYDDEDTDRMEAMADTSEAQLAALRTATTKALGR